MTLPDEKAESNTIDVPFPAVKSFPVTSLAPLANTATFPISYAKATPAESGPLT